MSDCEAYRMADCPFCGSEIVHVESLALAFHPPRIYHEWHHVEDNASCWIMHRLGKIVASANDNGEVQEAAVRRWNRRDRTAQATIAAAHRCPTCGGNNGLGLFNRCPTCQATPG